MGMSRQQAIDCFRSDDLIGIGMEADALRRRLHPQGVVTYTCVNIVNVDSALASAEADPTSMTLRLMTASANLDHLDKASAMCRTLYPSAWIEAGFYGSAVSIMDATETVAKCADAGVDSIFVDPRNECGDFAGVQTAALKLHRAAHSRGMHTVATIPFGCGESIQERLNFLEAVRALQEETGGFAAALPLGLQARGGRDLDGVTAVERLKMLAITRLCLDNVPHLRSVETPAGLKVLQTGLRFGADDAELHVPQRGTTEQDLRRVIRDAGFRPVERDGAYSMMFLN